jgi:hypothetical protein
MNRRRLQPTDSLEMLLDTMCNTFGGIILIALLIALLARDTPGKATDAPAPSETRLPLTEEAEHAELRLEQARARQAALEAQWNDPLNQRRRELAATREQVRAEAEQFTAARQAHATAEAQDAANSITQAKRRIAEALDRLRTVEQAHETQRVYLQDLHAQQRRVLQTMQRMTQQWTRLTTPQVQRMRLPRERPTTKTHLYIIVQQGRLYPLHFFRTGTAEPNRTTLQWHRENETTQRLEPLPRRGLRPDADAAAWHQFLSEVPRDRTYLIFQVYADSFAAFNTAKQAAVQHGFDYTWEARQTNEVLRVGAASAPPPPQ